MRELETETTKYDFMLDAMGFTDVPLEQRAVVLCKILKELEIPYRKYYTSPNHRYLRTQPHNNDFNNMGIIIIGNCEENYARYAIYLYEKKVQVISQLNNML